MELNNKKGIMFRNIVVGIIVLVIAGILILIVTTILNSSKETTDREACRASVILKSQSKILGTQTYDELNCGTQFKEVIKKDENEIYKLITYSMYDCWYQFGEGKKDFLEDWQFGSFDNWCHVCSRIEFDQTLYDEYTSLDGLFEYMKNERIPLSEGEQTFFEYFYGEDSELPIESQEINLDIKLNDPLYVAFFADKKFNWDRPMDSTATTLAVGGCLLGVLIAPVTFGTSAIAGCGGGIATVLIGDMVGRKDQYVAALYVGGPSEITDKCSQ